MRKPTIAGEIVKRMLEEYPTAGSLTLSKRLLVDHPELFATTEDARMMVRYYRGQIGKRMRREMADTRYVTDRDKLMRDRWEMPDAALTKREPYVIPKANDKIIVFGDLHIPYHHKNGIKAAIEYGLKKEVNCIILNGDIIDNYQISRFSKDGRKPNVEYELELLYDFLLNLRAMFPQALIVWKFGNHEERWDTYLKNNAPLLYMIGTMALEDHIPVHELGIIVVKDKRRIICGDLNILHGHEYSGGSGTVNPARSIFLRAKANCLINHFHRSSSHNETDLNGGQFRTYSLGSMCAPQDYMPYGNMDCSFAYIRIINGIAWVQNREVV